MSMLLLLGISPKFISFPKRSQFFFSGSVGVQEVDPSQEEAQGGQPLGQLSKANESPIHSAFVVCLSSHGVRLQWRRATLFSMGSKTFSLRLEKADRSSKASAVSTC